MILDIAYILGALLFLFACWLFTLACERL